MFKANWNGCEIHLEKSDITTLDVDAIVNPGNPGMGAGGGCCGAIFSKAGPDFAKECRETLKVYGMIPVGEAVITGAGNLPSKHVIHTVGPVYDENPREASELLASCYRNSLKLARNNNLKSVAFPCISTGVYGYPLVSACREAIQAVHSDIQQLGGIDVVVFCVFDSFDLALYEKEISR